MAHKYKYTFGCIFGFTKIIYLAKIAKNSKYLAQRKLFIDKLFVLIIIYEFEGMTINLRAGCRKTGENQSKGWP